MQNWGRRADGTIVECVDVELDDSHKTTAAKVFWPEAREFKIVIEFGDHREIVATGKGKAVSVSVGLCGKKPPEEPGK